jgi:hypothetical protein
MKHQAAATFVRECRQGHNHDRRLDHGHATAAVTDDMVGSGPPTSEDRITAGRSLSSFLAGREPVAVREVLCGARGMVHERCRRRSTADGAWLCAAPDEAAHDGRFSVRNPGWSIALAPSSGTAADEARLAHRASQRYGKSFVRSKKFESSKGSTDGARLSPR